MFENGAALPESTMAASATSVRVAVPSHRLCRTDQVVPARLQVVRAVVQEVLCHSVLAKEVLVPHLAAAARSAGAVGHASSSPLVAGMAMVLHDVATSRSRTHGGGCPHNGLEVAVRQAILGRMPRCSACRFSKRVLDLPAKAVTENPYAQSVQAW